jgi:hypothetical protein
MFRILPDIPKLASPVAVAPDRILDANSRPSLCASSHQIPSDCISRAPSSLPAGAIFGKAGCQHMAAAEILFAALSKLSA